jgi:cytoskeletal protein CcmA (bactofilin family)
MLGHKKAGGSLSRATTLVSKDTEIVGDIHFSGTLEVEGRVRGNITASADSGAMVRVVDKGCVEGEVQAPVIVINGLVQGNVHAGLRLELAPRARVEGDVFYTLVEMAVGAEVNGRLMHVDTQQSGQSEEQPGGQPHNVSELSRESRAGVAALAKVD